MRLRDALKAYKDGAITLEQCEHDVLYECDECTYTECEEEDEDEPFVQPKLTSEQFIALVDGVPPAEREELIKKFEAQIGR